jgi:uncharacterized protein
MLIGRENEKQILQDALKEEYSQFIAVYGRRRVGKTFLIREAYNYQFAFQFTGAADTSTSKQLIRFRNALKAHGLKDVPPLTNWIDAFFELERYIDGLPQGKKVIFFDELPWMDAPRSGFLSELEVFWNGWASARKDIVFVVCGSATAWMVKKILKNKGGLHNRLSHRIPLQPFTLDLCERMADAQNLALGRMQILEAYMVFGGVPYYWTLLRPGNSIAQEVDRLVFSEDGDLHDEFQMLYASLFANPKPYIEIIEALAGKKMGLSREEIVTSVGMKSSGTVTSILEDLEWCGFIRKYNALGKKTKDALFQLIDPFTLFYFEFVRDNRSKANYWQYVHGFPKYNTWCGLAFERVCFAHIEQIKRKLGISGVLAGVYSWRCAPNEEEGYSGVQIDMLIDRNDGIIDLCEMKYSDTDYSISSAYAQELSRKRSVFQKVSKTHKAVHLVLVTTHGVAPGAWQYSVQSSVLLDDLFA